MIEFIGPLYKLLQDFTDHYLPLGTRDFWPHYSSNWSLGYCWLHVTRPRVRPRKIHIQCLSTDVLYCCVFVAADVFTESLPSNGSMRRYIYIYVHIYILYNVRVVPWSLLTTNCTRYSTEDAVRIGNSFITIPLTRNYNHSQLSIMRLHNYNPYTFVTKITYSTLTLADFSAINYCLELSHTLHLHTSKLSPRSHSANSPLKTP
jgi:hypothetical protein